MEFAGVFAIIFALSLTVTKAVDFIRNVADKDDTWPKWSWNVAAFVIGLLFCLGWQKNFAADLLSLVPAFQGDSVNDFVGYVISGFVLGGLSGFGHEFLDALSSIATKNRSVTPAR
jgi:hypothetical protein